MYSRLKNTGFTIVELLIVIVVIAILAAISIVAYNGIQDRANDAAVRSGADRFIKALYQWNAETGQLPRGGWSSTTAIAGNNCADGQGGWTYSGGYTCTVEDVLRSANHLPAGFTLKLPKNSAYLTSAPDGRYTLMFYPCGSGGKFALFYHLRSPSSQDSADVSAVEAAGCTTSPRTTYGMRGAKLISL
jgi:prepilin-type N-terminal cleavage/methylation domain-containing protein